MEGQRQCWSGLSFDIDVQSHSPQGSSTCGSDNDGGLWSSAVNGRRAGQTGRERWEFFFFPSIISTFRRCSSASSFSWLRLKFQSRCVWCAPFATNGSRLFSWSHQSNPNIDGPVRNWTHFFLYFASVSLSWSNMPRHSLWQSQIGQQP